MNIIFLGNGAPHSLKAERFIKELDCDNVTFQNKPKRFDDYPKKYDIGFSFLYPFLVPSNEIKKSKVNIIIVCLFIIFNFTILKF